VARLNVRHAVIDAECVCDGDNGVTDFERLLARVHDASAYAPAFDLLALDGDDMRRQPLANPKAALAKLLRKAKPGIRYSEHVTGDDRNIFEHACKLGLEGIVSKRINAPYRSGKVKTWPKTKNPKAAAVQRVHEGGW
jgi:bifunctional non-homologous end joining protein LigD